MKARFIMIALFALNIFQMSAQNKDEVTLVVSADGATKEEATKVALRSAIEQAYGTFVSANTTILNDELVKDEIVTISNGNIKKYKEIASWNLPNGNQCVTLQATVCISKLVSYAQSKGASTEFAGATFMMNIKMKELNKKNEQEALNNLLNQIRILITYSYDRNLEIATPKQDGKGNYIMDIKLKCVGNNKFLAIRDLLFYTLIGVSLEDDEAEEYKSMNLNYLRFDMDIRTKGQDIGYTHCWAYLRNDQLFFDKWCHELLSIICKERSDYKVVDNNGKVWQSGSNESIKRLPHLFVAFNWKYGEYFGGDYSSDNASSYIGSLSKNAMWNYKELYGNNAKAGFEFVISYDSYEDLQFLVGPQYMQTISKIDVVRK